jgi:hypothetical protein
MTLERRFLCDEMLVGLGRWLRIAGYDTVIAERGRNDRELGRIGLADEEQTRGAETGDQFRVGGGDMVAQKRAPFGETRNRRGQEIEGVRVN